LCSCPPSTPDAYTLSLHDALPILDKNALPLRVSEDRTVVRHQSPGGNSVGTIPGSLPFDDARKKRMAKVQRQARGQFCKLRVFKRKRRGCFRPDQQVGLLRAWGEAHF